ncbi:MAG TPA: EscU/YscU/HrcU family type III secretion system export apparatus switch protein [Acidimicrobiia bacterium]|nr:EscU/YscU/HrcU family type III secretion system export apparatus switch protein [Acidimicrobiia bacterium]
MSSDKTEQPTAKKKRDARRDGNLARSPEVVAWAQMLAAGVLLPASFSLGTHSLRQVMTQVGVAITRPDVDASVRLMATALTGGLLAVAPLAIGMVAVGLVGNFAQIGFAFSGKALKPKFDRISPKKGLKRLLSPHSAWEAGKAAVKLLVLTAVAWPGVSHLGAALAGGGRVPAAQVMTQVAGATMGLIRSTALAGLALAAADYAFQRRRVKKGMMMTKQEVKEEYRQSEGDPMTRQRIRQRQVEMSRNRMMAAVAVSSVVVVNPTHIAVALEYSAELGAPRVVAKGQGHIAARIREEAEKHNVPIVRDVPLARTLHAACKLGQTIPADLYEAVARLLAFVFSLKRTA